MTLDMSRLNTLAVLFGTLVAALGLTCAVAPVATEYVIVAIVAAVGLG